MATEKNRLSKTLFGALNLKNSRFYWKQADKGNSRQFIQFLYQLRQVFPKKKIILIVDNGSIHKSQKVRGFLKRNTWVELMFLPPYSPEYNPIERFWHWLKQKVYGCKSFSSVESLIGQIRKFIWHYHENNLVSPIQFNFKAYLGLL